MNRWKILFLTAFVLAAIMACRKSSPGNEQAPAVPVKTAVVKEQLLTLPVRTSGRLAAKTESKLSFKTGGIIQKIYVDEGQSVKEGQLLAILNLSEIQPRARQAELALEKARRDYDRVKNLYRDSVATLEQFQDAGTALDFARTNEEIARFNLDYSQIKAPLDGRILKRVAESNEIVGPGQPIFLFAATESAWIVRVNLTDKDIVHIRLNDSCTVSFDAYPGEIFYGRISETGNSADPYTGTYEAEIVMKEQPESLVSGFIVKVNIFPSGTVKRMILVPAGALQEGDGLNGNVWVIREEKPVKQAVEIFAMTDQGIIVSAGLVEGDEVIVEGGEYIREGVNIERVR